MCSRLFWDLWGRVGPAGLGPEMSYLQQKRGCAPASLDLLPCCGVGGSSHLLLLTLLGPPQVGKLISGGPGWGPGAQGDLWRCLSAFIL